MKQRKAGFTLIEILLGILIVTTVIISGFQALSAVGTGKIRLIQETNLQKDAFLFSERLFTAIKQGGIIDFEEYFNREVIDSTFSSGHYINDSGYGNFGFGGITGSTTYGEEFYYCRSGVGIANKISGSGGCVATNNYVTGVLKDRDFSNTPQRYGQYSFQFLDYNSNYNNDDGDENGIDGIKGDDDDEYTGFGPEAFGEGENLPELYLMSGDKRKRTYFRFSVKRDPDSPPTAICNVDSNNVITGTGCLGTVEVLYLEGRDWGMDHIASSNDFTEYDGVIDTWIIAPRLTSNTSIIAGTENMDPYWTPLFPQDINVSKFSLFVYPNIDGEKAWKQTGGIGNVAPYLRLAYSLSPSWKTKRYLSGNIRDIPFSTTINLTDIYSK